jgi:hypothetical protein
MTHQPRVRRIYAFLRKSKEGTEDLVGIGMPNGVLVPLVSTSLRGAKALRPLAQALCEQSGVSATLTVFGDRRSLECFGGETRIVAARTARALSLV